MSAAGGSYRRYSDDILILCSPEHMTALEAAVEDALKVHTKTLSLNADKREEARFAVPGRLSSHAPRKHPKAITISGVYLRRSASLHTRRNAFAISSAHGLQCARGEGPGGAG